MHPSQHVQRLRCRAQRPEHQWGNRTSRAENGGSRTIRLEQRFCEHGVTAAQVALAWLLEQDGVAVIPNAQRRESQKSNLDALAVKLDDDDRQAIAVLPKNHRFVTPPFAPDWNA
jgi:diketogulonate reductase-like aldo/keto reductase